MTIRLPTYVELIGEFYPNCYVSAIGVEPTYESLLHVGGDPLPSKATLDNLMLDKIKALKSMEVNAYRDEYLFDRFVYDNKRWDCDEVARGNINGALTIGMVNGNALTPGMSWRDYDNQNWAVDFAYIAAMAGALTAFTNATYVSSWSHKTNIQNLTTVQDVIEYNYTAGWPVRDT